MNLLSYDQGHFHGAHDDLKLERMSQKNMYGER